MEKEINIAEILKDKPQGTKLYADAFGELEYCGISNDKDPRIFVESKECTSYSFYNNGKYNKYGEPILFPSKEMRDWSKFVWKKGDVLVNSRGLKILFNRWTNDNYASFYAKTINLVEDCFLDTNLHTLASEKDAKSFIKCIEEKLGGKLNRETLEVEKAQPEFKDGDIVHDVHGYNTYIIKEFTNKHIKIYAGLSKQYGAISHKIGISSIFHLRLATDSEKQQLFDALSKKGKRWDAEKKQIVDLKPKVEFKPFDKVVVRDKEDLVWFADLFSHIDKENNRFACVGNFWNVCLPYNEETAKLIGTTNNVEG